MSETDVLIVGAGAAGALTRAGRCVAIVEARRRIGGRIHTIASAAFAGEAVAPGGHIGTVHAALASGERAVNLIL